MIISDKHKFVFIHIPKCAGTSIRSQLQNFDDTGGAYTSKVALHGQLGLLDYVHIPLSIIREYFPAEYERLLAYQSFAVIRDPFERFPSSLAQHIRMYKKEDLRRLKDKDLEKEIDEVINYLSDVDINTDPTFIHFEKQISFVDLDNEPVVKNVYRIDDIGLLLSDIGQLVNANATVPVDEPLPQKQNSCLSRSEGRFSNRVASPNSG